MRGKVAYGVEGFIADGLIVLKRDRQEWEDS